jgi:hypothetical protein
MPDLGCCPPQPAAVSQARIQLANRRERKSPAAEDAWCQMQAWLTKYGVLSYAVNS